MPHHPWRCRVVQKSPIGAPQRLKRLPAHVTCLARFEKRHEAHLVEAMAPASPEGRRRTGLLRSLESANDGVLSWRAPC
eukprot:841683-Alexandrium_andersonii.AAC.1